MKYIVNNNLTQNKELVYEESFWSGKKTVTYNTTPLTKIKRNVFEYQDGEKTETFEVKGNSFIGVKINMFGRDVEVLRQLVWYEILLSVLVLLPGILFGGMIGGFIAGVLGVLNLFIIRHLDKWYFKVLVTLGILAGEVLLLFVIGVILLKIFKPII